MLVLSQPPSPPVSTPSWQATFSLGLRPFFLLGSLFSLVSIGYWGGIIAYGWDAPALEIPLSQWHAHEMLFGYAAAIIAGFLLTAVRNWTGLPTAHGSYLALLCCSWLIARLQILLNPAHLIVALVADLAFGVGLLVALAIPLWRTRQWAHLAVISKVLILVAANGVWYSAALNPASEFSARYLQLGLDCGWYMVLALMLLLARRVMPMFIERGCGVAVNLINRSWVDRSSLVLLLLLWLADIAAAPGVAMTVLAGALGVVHSIRLAGWHTRALWRKPLLWVLYLAYASIIFGFGMLALHPFFPQLHMPALHAFAVGGIGMMSMGMMTRVSLGHTGRNVQCPPAQLTWLFIGLGLAALVRTLFPVLLPQYYLTWIAAAQILWVAAYAGFLWLYTPILLTHAR